MHKNQQNVKISIKQQQKLSKGLTVCYRCLKDLAYLKLNKCFCIAEQKKLMRLFYVLKQPIKSFLELPINVLFSIYIALTYSSVHEKV